MILTNQDCIMKFIYQMQKMSPEKWKTVIRHPICKIDKK